jgi:hypothetical protein
MKHLLISLVVIAASAAVAQDKAVQSGTPSKLTVINGKQANVFLQHMKDGNLTFQPHKSDQNMTVPAEKIKFLEFFPKYDAEGTLQSFQSGEFEQVISVLEPIMNEYWQYMPIDNNLRDAFSMLIDSYMGTGNYAQVKKAAATFIQSDNEDIVLKAKVRLAEAEVAEGNVAAAEKIKAELEGSVVPDLYLRAVLQRASQQPKAAVITISDIIYEHGNAVDWLPRCELLSAYVYLDMAMTNSAVQTARQVKNMYKGTSISASAARLYNDLGGEAAMSGGDETPEPSEGSTNETTAVQTDGSTDT